MPPEKFGRYEVKQELGRGGMAVVYLARDPHFDRQVAIKALPPQSTLDPTYLASFKREAKIIASLDHAAIVPVYDFGEYEHQPYLVMRYMPGGSLRDRMGGDPLSFIETARIFNRLAPALDKAHRQGIIHRDLKPGNILFDEENKPYLADFGIARLAEATQTVTSIGTPSYMSPEQIHSSGNLDFRCDLYALGIMLFEMLTGRLPYVAETALGVTYLHVHGPIPNIIDANPNLPHETKAVIDKAIAKTPAERYQSASELAAIVALLARRDSESDPEKTIIDQSPVPPPRITRNWTRWTLGFFVMLLAFLVVTGFLFYLIGDGKMSPAPVAQTEVVWVSSATSTPTVVTLAVVTPTEFQPAPTNSLPQATSIVAPTTLPIATLTPSSTPTATFDPQFPPPSPTLGSLWRRPKDGMDMAYVPAGQFDMGSSDSDINSAMASCLQTGGNCSRDWFEDEFPQHQVSLNAFWIDQTEVTNAQFAIFLSEMGNQIQGTTDWFDINDSDAMIESDGGGIFEAKDGFANHPATLMTWYAAKAYCEWAGGHLPTEAMWEYAAKGSEGTVFPWGDNFTAANLNYCDVNCSSDIRSRVVNDNYSQTSPVGSFSNGASWVGALDMAGNVWEWTSDWYGESYYSDSSAKNPIGPDSGQTKVMRGGSWFSPEHYVRTSVRNASVRRSFSRNDYGIRCVS